MEPITDFGLRIGEKTNATETKESAQACEEEQRVNRIPEIQNRESEIIRVLLIEDNPGDARLVREMLIETGINKFNLEHVERISEGLNRLRQDNFQVILLDLSLLDSHGLEIVDRVCNVAPYVPVLVLTGLDDETLAIRAVQNGAQDYLVKGQMVGNQLVRAIRHAIERKRAEEALRESEERYRTILDNIEDGYFEVDIAGNFTFFNDSLCGILGYSRDEMMGMNNRQYTDEENAKKLYQAFNKVYRTGKPTKGFDWEIIRKDGTKRYIETSVSLIKNSSGQPIGFRGIVRDITERKRAEEEMAAVQEQFRQSQKMEAIGQLAGGIAHDFNNLLTVIKGYSQIASMELKEGDPLKERIELIKRAADRAADLTRQLLAFSRRQILEFKVIDLNTALRNLEKMLRRVIGEDIELVIHLPEDLGGVKTDPGQIEQVIMNLAVNAKDAMPDGGKLVIETANVDLDEEYVRNHVAVIPGRYVMLAVSDTGVGMTPEIKEKVFEPFFTTKKKGEGTGLGLSTVYGIVKQSGGNIWVYSELRKGTTFKIYLPRVDEPLDEISEKVTVRKGLLRGSETILVVEDEEEVRKLVVRGLEGQGYRVLDAPQGFDAFLIGEEHQGPIHLLVTDVVMPKMSGRELAERILEILPEVKVLYMSGYTDNTIVHYGMLEKGVNYIQKPFTVEGLVQKVREVLDKK